jgi:beta-lactamase class A
MYPTASVFKLAIMVEAFAQASEGHLSLDDRHELERSDQLGGTGVLGDLNAGLRLTVHDLVTLMIIASDNTATNMLLDLVGGVDPVNQRIRGFVGRPDFVVHTKIDFDAIGMDARRLAEATPRAVAALLSQLARGTLVDERSSAQMFAIMSRQLYLDQFPRYFDYNRSRKELGLSEDFKVACKTGVFPGVRTDAGIVDTPAGRFVYCSMTDGSKDLTDAVESEGSITNGRLGRLLLEYWWPAAAARKALLPSRYLP